MAHEHFASDYFVDAPLDQVFAYFADPDRYARSSPIITEVSNIRHGRNPQGQPFYEYESVEALHVVNLIPYNNPIHVQTTLTEVNRQVVSHVDTRLGVNLDFVFNLEPENGGTRIHETIDFHMPRLFQSYVVSQAKAVQQARIQIFKSRLEPAIV